MRAFGLLSVRSRPDMGSLRVAVVGLGWVGTHRHLPWLKRNPGVEVVGVIDHTPARVERAKALFRVREGAIAEGPHAVTWLDDIDAVTIATPPATHVALARAYLLAGKDVLLEKPMALEVGAARELAEIAEREGRVLAIVHNFQFARSTMRLKGLITLEGWGRSRPSGERSFRTHAAACPTGMSRFPWDCSMTSRRTSSTWFAASSAAASSWRWCMSCRGRMGAALPPRSRS